MRLRFLMGMLALGAFGCADSDSPAAETKAPASTCTCSPGECSVSTGDPCAQGMACDVGTLECPGSTGWQPGYACECGPDGKTVCGSPKCVTPGFCNCYSGTYCNVETGDPCETGLQCAGGDKICPGLEATDYIECRCGNDFKVVCEQQKCQMPDAGAVDAPADVSPGE